VGDNHPRGQCRHRVVLEVGLADLRLDENAVADDEVGDCLLAPTVNLRLRIYGGVVDAVPATYACPQ
jgi:hypothetical protein